VIARVDKRYSQLLEMHKQLVNYLPSWAALPEFPPKQYEPSPPSLPSLHF